MCRDAILTASIATSKQSLGVARGDHRDRRVGVAAVDRLIQIGLLGLRRQARRRAAALRVDDHDGSSVVDRESDRFAF